MPYHIRLRAEPNRSIIALHRFAADYIIAQCPDATSTYVSFTSPEWVALNGLPAQPRLLAHNNSIPEDVRVAYKEKLGNTRQNKAEGPRFNEQVTRERRKESEQGTEKKGVWETFKQAWKESQKRTRVDRTTANTEDQKYFVVAWIVDTAPEAKLSVVEGTTKCSLTAVGLPDELMDPKNPFDDLYEIYRTIESNNS